MSLYTHAIVRFDDGIYTYVPKKNIKYTPYSVVTKWKSSSYNVELLCLANKEACHAVTSTLNGGDFPRVVFERCSNLTQVNNPCDKDVITTEDISEQNFECKQFGTAENDEDLYILDTAYVPTTDDILHADILLLPPAGECENENIDTIYAEQYSSNGVEEQNQYLMADEPESSMSSNSVGYVPSSNSSNDSSDSELLANPRIRVFEPTLDPGSDSDGFDSDEHFESNTELESLDIDKIVPTRIQVHSQIILAPGNLLQSKKKNPCYPKKKNYCTFCKKTNTNIERHFQQVHCEEPEVKRFVILPKNCPQRRRFIAELRLRGNFEYNSKALHSDADLVVARKINNIPKSKYTVCPKCKIFITKPALRRHYRNCYENIQSGTNRGILSNSKALFNYVHPLANEILKTCILSSMRDDVIFSLIKYDKLLVVYGNAMCMKYRSRHHYDMIKNRLRIMGRFLQVAKSVNPAIDDFASLYQPPIFDTIIEVLHQFGNYDKISGYYEKPTLPSTIGTALKYIANLYIMECIKSRDEKQKKDVEDVLVLLKTGLQGPVNKTAAESLLHQKRQKKEVLPLTEDVRKLNAYITSNQQKYYEEISDKEFSVASWLNLLKFTLISILVFNRKRPGELERAMISDLNNLQYIDEQNSEAFESLSEEAKKAAKSYARFTIRGKLARGVPVLLNKNNNTYIKLLIRFRRKAGVHKDNPYVFGLPQKGVSNSFRYLRAGLLLAKYSVDCGAKNPSLLRATLLRKHVATKSAQMKLDSHNVENLQNFLGHAPKIHNEYYKQPIINRDIINMSQLLEIAQGTKTNKVAMGSPTLDDEIAMETTILSDEISHETTLDVDAIETALDESEFDLTNSSSLPSPSMNKTLSTSNTNVKRTRLIDMDLGYVPRKSWTTPEKQNARDLFANCIESNVLPSLKDCKIAQQNNIHLKNRSPQQLRLWIHNEINKKKRPNAAKGWTDTEKKIINEVFQEYIKPGCSKYPSTTEIMEVISTYKEIQHRTPTIIKSRIQYLKKLALRDLNLI